MGVGQEKEFYVLYDTCTHESKNRLVKMKNEEYCSGSTNPDFTSSAHGFQWNLT